MIFCRGGGGLKQYLPVKFIKHETTRIMIFIVMEFYQTIKQFSNFLTQCVSFFREIGSSLRSTGTSRDGHLKV